MGRVLVGFSVGGAALALGAGYLLERLNYHAATLASDALQGWQATPYPMSQDRYLGVVRVRGTSWRKPGAAIKLVTVNHPRLIRPQLGAVLDHLARDVVWDEGFAVQSDSTYSQQVPGGVAEARLIDIVASYSAEQALQATPLPGSRLLGGFANQVIPAPAELPALASQRVAILTMAWHTGGGPLLPNRAYNDHFLVGTAGPADKDFLVNQVPSLVRYI